MEQETHPEDFPRKRWFRGATLIVIAVVVGSIVCCGGYFLAGLRPKPEPADCFMLPVEPYEVAQAFGVREPSGQVHLGEDIPQPAGARVVSAAGGYVAFAGEVEGHGGMVVLEHRLADGTALLSIYGNLDPDSIEVPRGQLIRRGRTVAKIAAQSTEPGIESPHLHLGFRQGTFGRTWDVYGWGPEEKVGEYLAPSTFLKEHACP